MYSCIVSHGNFGHNEQKIDRKAKIAFYIYFVDLPIKILNDHKWSFHVLQYLMKQQYNKPV